MSLDEEFSRRALESGALTPEALERCRRESEADGTRSIAEIAVESGLLEPGELARVLAGVAGQARIGDLAIERKYVSIAQLDECLEEQRRHPQLMVGQLLLQKRFLSTPQFLDLMREQHRLAPVPRRIGKYSIEGVVGEGAMGIVFKARDSELGREVALKILRAGELADRRMIERFHREAQNAARLQHPGIVTVYEAGREDEILYIAMELVAGVPLSKFRRDRDGMVEIVEQAARAVHAAHEKGIVHRDLKPGNILVDAKGRPHIVDFGLSRAVDSDHGVTKTGTALGTPFYMPPEQVRGDIHAIDGRSDVYSLGVVLYEILTGEVPFTGTTSIEVFQKITGSDPPRPSSRCRDLPRDLEIICLKAMEKEARHRYASALAFADDLRRCLSGEPIQAQPASTLRRVVTKVKRNPVAAAALTVAGLTLVAAGVVLAIVRVRRAGEEKRHAEETARLTGRQKDLEEEAARRKARDEASALLESARPSIEGAILCLYSRAFDYAELVRRVDEGQKRIEQALEKDPDLALGHYLLGRAWEIKGWEDRAAASWTRALELDPRFVSARFHLGRLRLMQAVFAAAGATEEERAASKPRAEALARDGAREIEEALRQAMGMDDVLERDLAAALQAFVRFDFEGTLKIARKAIETYSGREGREEFHWIIGLIVEGDERLQALNLAIEVRPKFPAALMARALVHEEAGRQDAALADLSELLKISPRNPEAWVNRGRILAKRGDRDGAISDYGEALKLEPRLWGALYNRGNARKAKGDFDGAVADYDAAIAVKSDVARVYLNRGNALAGKGDFHGDIADCTRAIRLDAKFAEAWSNRSWAYYQLGEWTPAIEDGTRAVELAPRMGTAWFNRGNAYCADGQFDKALADYDRAIEIDPKDADALCNRGWVKQRKGDLRGAVDDYAKALEVAPAGWPARKTCGRLLADARAALEK